MIKKILVPTDGSDHARKAIEVACDIALKYAATICLLHVVSLPAISHEGVFPAMEGMLKFLEEDGKKIIEEAERETKKWGRKMSSPPWFTEILRTGSSNLQRRKAWI